jgi:hypothetical protein
MTDYRETAEAAIEAIERAAERLAIAVQREMLLEDRRPLVKAEAVKRIMQRDSLAATPAEKIVESDDAYLAHRVEQYAAVVETIRARAAYEAAKRRADMSVDLAFALSGLGDHLDTVKASTLGPNATRADALEVIR